MAQTGGVEGARPVPAEVPYANVRGPSRTVAAGSTEAAPKVRALLKASPA